VTEQFQGNDRSLASLLLVLSVLAFSLAMRTRAQPAFRGEYLLEDVSIVLSVACAVVRPKFRRVMLIATLGLVTTTIAILAWLAIGTRLDLIFAVLFAGVAIYTAVRAVLEFAMLINPHQRL
jgi:hypothetical protein